MAFYSISIFFFLFFYFFFSFEGGGKWNPEPVSYLMKLASGHKFKKKKKFILQDVNFAFFSLKQGFVPV